MFNSFFFSFLSIYPFLENFFFIIIITFSFTFLSGFLTIGCFEKADSNYGVRGEEGCGFCLFDLINLCCMLAIQKVLL